MPRLLLPLALVGLLLPTVTVAYSNDFPPVANNPADRMTRTPIDEPQYDRSTRCVKNPSRGGIALQSWLQRNWRGESWGIMRCAKLSPNSYSLHAEGRAIDWRLDIGNPEDDRAARKLISLLLATDKAGNQHALARRMGVQEIIRDCRIWWAGLERMERYSACYTASGKLRKGLDPSTAHRDHVHIGLNRSGARMQTSFWKR